MVGIELAFDHAVLLEFLEPARKHAGRESRERIGEILEAPRAIQEEVAKDQNGPAISDHIERASDGTVESVRLGHWEGGEGLQQI